MSTTMTLDILTPERSVCCVEAEIVIARALDGRDPKKIIVVQRKLVNIVV